MRWREKQTLDPKTFLLAVSQSVADSFCRYAGIIPDRCCVISNAIDPLFFKEQALKFLRPDSARSLISVGRLVPEKNHALVLKALKRIPNSLRPRFEIYGEGPLKIELLQLAKHLDVDLRTPGLCQDLHRLLS